MTKAMARAYSGVRKQRTTWVLLLVAAPALLWQVAAFVALTTRAPKAPALTPRSAAEEGEMVSMPTKMTDLKVGQELTGIITRVQERIALVDIGVEKVALLPASKLIDGRLEQPVQEVLHEGDPIKVYVAEIESPEDPRTGKVVLAGHKNKIVNVAQFGNRSKISDVKAAYEKEVEAKEKVFKKGVVIGEKDFGVVVAFRCPEIPGITSGLVFKTEVKGNPQVLEQVMVRIVGVEEKGSGGRVSLSMREEEPLKGQAARFSDFRELEGQNLEATVQGFADFGAFVQVTSPSGTPSNALLPNSEIKDGFVEDPAEELEEGQKFMVKLLAIGEKGLRVSKKQAEAAPKAEAPKEEEAVSSEA